MIEIFDSGENNKVVLCIINTIVNNIYHITAFSKQFEEKINLLSCEKYNKKLNAKLIN